jgi:hypothetical protein
LTIICKFSVWTGSDNCFKLVKGVPIKWNKYNTVGTVPNFNRQILERVQIDTPNLPF